MGPYSPPQSSDNPNSVSSNGASTDADAMRRTRYDRIAVFVVGGVTVLGIVLGLVVTIMAVSKGLSSGRRIVAAIGAPLLFGSGGYMYGVALMSLIAPRSFLTGPVGRSWMQVIGTKNVDVARIACLLFGLIVTAVLVGIAFRMARGN